MRLKFSLILVILGLSTLVSAQPKIIQKANDAYASENYATSAKLCEDAYQKLSKYFDSIKRSLSNSSGQEEIMKDIEVKIIMLELK